MAKHLGNLALALVLAVLAIGITVVAAVLLVAGGFALFATAMVQGW